MGLSLSSRLTEQNQKSLGTTLMAPLVDSGLFSTRVVEANVMGLLGVLHVGEPPTGFSTRTAPSIRASWRSKV